MRHALVGASAISLGAKLHCRCTRDHTASSFSVHDAHNMCIVYYTCLAVFDDVTDNFIPSDSAEDGRHRLSARCQVPCLGTVRALSVDHQPKLQLLTQICIARPKEGCSLSLSTCGPTRHKLPYMYCIAENSWHSYGNGTHNIHDSPESN